MRDERIIDWYFKLPSGYLERAIDNINQFPLIRRTSRCDTMPEALMQGFCWSQSKEGLKFWNAVYEHYMYQKPLPELPSE